MHHQQKKKHQTREAGKLGGARLTAVPGAGGRHNLRHARMIVRPQVAHAYPQQRGPKYLQPWPSDAPFCFVHTGDSHRFVTCSYRRGNGLGCHRHSRPVSALGSAGSAPSNARQPPRLDCTILSQCHATGDDSSGHEPHPCLQVTPPRGVKRMVTQPNQRHPTSHHTLCDPNIHSCSTGGRAPCEIPLPCYPPVSSRSCGAVLSPPALCVRLVLGYQCTTPCAQSTHALAYHWSFMRSSMPGRALT